MSSSTERGGTIGLVLFDVMNPFFTEMAAAVEERAALDGFTIRIADSGGDHRREIQEAERFAEQGMSGVMIAPVEGDMSHLAALRAAGLPVVLVGTKAETPGVPSVAVDGARGGYLAAEHLLQQGHRRIMMVTGPLGSQVRDRVAGARRAVQEVDGARLLLRQVSAPTLAQGIAVGEEIPNLARRPDAVLAVNDLLALGVMQAVTGRGGLRVPEDLAIVGYDDLGIAASASVPLTSVRQPRRRMGAIATDMMFAALRGETAGPHVLLEPQLVVRASSRASRLRQVSPLNAR